MFTGKRMMMLMSLIMALVLIAACGGGSTPSNQPSDGNQGSGAANEAGGNEGSKNEAAEFYKGKTIEFIVTYGAGGGYDTMARQIAPYIEEYTGASVIVRNVPGGGGLVGTNTLYKAKPDGLTIGLLNGGTVVTSQILHEKDVAKVEGVQYDINKFSYLGRVTGGPQVIFTKTGHSELKTADDLFNYQGELVSGNLGPTGDLELNIQAVQEAMNLPIRFVFGYDGLASVELAAMSGEIDLSIGSAQDRMPKILSGDLQPLVLIGGEYAELPDVPQALEYANDQSRPVLEAIDTLIAIGRPIAMPPEVPEERRQFLEEALKFALENPTLRAEWSKLGSGWLGPWLPVEDFKAQVDSISNNPPQILLDIWKEKLN